MPNAFLNTVSYVVSGLLANDSMVQGCDGFSVLLRISELMIEHWFDLGLIKSIPDIAVDLVSAFSAVVFVEEVNKTKAQVRWDSHLGTRMRISFVFWRWLSLNIVQRIESRWKKWLVRWFTRLIVMATVNTKESRLSKRKLQTNFYWNMSFLQVINESEERRFFRSYAECN